MFSMLKKLFGNTTDYKGLVSNGAIILDVRSEGEFGSGHIKGATNIPLEQVKQNIPALKKKNKPVITVCRSGVRSGIAKSVLAAAGIEVYNGGAWNALQQKIQ
ncbi:MAG: rhodanese-like domain-containing protein [Sphingobacteriales bacterium]|mgnify:CR=1 FL=1|nr:rhodanese-like domain-containing protein [Sphingobacteriales bacterium]OJY84673.1 MAG: sulfurtransferase [Sphingobacteriales bacterium 44-15]